MQTSTEQVLQTSRYQEKREAILAAAARLFNEQGVRGATLTGIAASVGLVTNSVTYYYRKKEDLACACFLRSIKAFDAVAETASSESGVPARIQTFFRLHAQLLADIEEGRRSPIVVFSDIRAVPNPQSEEVFAAYTAMFRRVRSLLKGTNTEHLSRDDLNARGHILLSLANWMWSWMGRYETAEYQRVADRVSDVLIHGIAASGSRWLSTQSETQWQLSSAMDGTSDAFLRAATDLVNEQGYRGASVDKISARLSLTKGSFYHHHDKKHDLISECFERTFEVMRRALSLAESSSGSGWSRACAAARMLVRYQLSAQGPLLRVSATSALPEREQRERVRMAQLRLTERMVSVIVDGMVDGSIRPLDPAIAAQSAIAIINAAAELRRWVASAKTTNVADLYVRAAFEGVLCPGAQIDY